MNKNEAEEIAWEIIKLEESFGATGVDAAMVVANQAADTIQNLLANLKIKQAYEELKQSSELGRNVG